jgi:hypothetical protein
MDKNRFSMLIKCLKNIAYFKLEKGALAVGANLG